MKKNIGAGVAVALILAVTAVGIYVGSWWIARDSTNRRAQINQDSYGRQNALVEQIIDDIEEASDPAIPAAQRAALVDIVCDSAAKLTGSIALPNYAVRFVASECPA